MDAREFDVVVIGAGPVGENVADRAVRGGLTAVIVEAELVGGECSYWACMPSKALLRAGAAQRAAEAVGVVGGRVDPEKVLSRRDAFTSRWDDAGQVTWLASAGIELVRGHGRIAGERVVRVSDPDGDADETELWARQAVVIATGSEPVIPPTPGLVDAEPWTSREVTAMKQVPESVAIVGGGVVAVEAATFLADLGARVSIVARSGLLGGFDPIAGEAVRDRLRERGVDVREGAQAASVVREGGAVRVEIEGGDVLEVEEIVVATGRRPRLRDVGLESIDLEADAVAVDDTLRQDGSDWLYVVGDANDRAPLTHQGKYQARVAGDAIALRAQGREIDAGSWGHESATADLVAVPQVVFSDPEVASVGVTATQAEERGIHYRVVDCDLGGVAGAALHADGYRGTARAVIDEERRVLIGMTLVGPDVAELLQAATIAIVGEVPLDRLWHAVPAYPTISELWLRLLEAYGL